ncbi:MAG TPA: DnaJ domain-containing protein [Desulfatiglandales bacterium]|nr:DnaJ domain-containing protein [Desulfatiglandales bacterium]
MKNAYRKLANKYHPDKVDHLGDEFRVLAEQRFKEIQEAYQELVNR